MEINKLNYFMGKTIKEILGAEKDSTKIIFMFDDNTSINMTHFIQCCEDVRVEDIDGDINDLIGYPILQAEEVINESDNPNVFATSTWTFYKFATIKGYVTIRWLGESNGWYSERVNFEICESNGQCFDDYKIKNFKEKIENEN